MDILGFAARLSALVVVSGATIGPLTASIVSASQTTFQVQGGSPEAHAEAKSELEGLSRELAPETITRLDRLPIRLDLIPAGGRLTDLPDFAYLHDVSLAYGRRYDDVRGVGGILVKGQVVFAVGEEEFLPGGSYGRGYELAHEVGHVIRHWGLSAHEDSLVVAAYSAREAAHGPWLDPTSYSAANDDEYFAQAFAATTSTAFSAEFADEFTPAWLSRTDPLIAAAMRGVMAG